MKLKVSKGYSSAIEEQDVRKVFSIFWENLRLFCEEMKEIYSDWLRVKDVSMKQDNYYRVEYQKCWHQFVMRNPLPRLYRHKDYNLKDIIPKDKKKLTGYETNIQEFYDWVIKYTAHIVNQESKSNPMREFIIITVLSAIERSVDLSSMSIKVDDILGKIDDVYVEIKEGKFTPPPIVNYFDGEIFEGHLSSSKKVAIYRGKVLRRWLNQYLMEYKELNNGKYPNRKEIKDHLIKRCSESGDERLQIFKNKMSPKTLNKLLDGYQDMISSHRNTTNDIQPITESKEGKKLTLMEVYNLLKIGYKKLNE